LQGSDCRAVARKKRRRACDLLLAMKKEVILLLFAYPKNAAADLTPRQVSQLAKVVKEEFGH
jgi:hypothetical protein